MKGVLSLDHMVWGLGWRCVAGTDLGPVARSLVSANRWLRGIKMYRFPWYLTLVSTNHASSNPGLEDTRILLALCFYRQCLIIDYYVLFSAYLGKMSTQPHFMHKCSTLFMFTVCVKMHKIATTHAQQTYVAVQKSYPDLCSDITTWQSLLFQIYFNLRVMYWYFVSLVNSMVF